MIEEPVLFDEEELKRVLKTDVLDPKLLKDIERLGQEEERHREEERKKHKVRRT